MVNIAYALLNELTYIIIIELNNYTNASGSDQGTDFHFRKRPSLRNHRMMAFLDLSRRIFSSLNLDLSSSHCLMRNYKRFNLAFRLPYGKRSQRNVVKVC